MKLQLNEQELNAYINEAIRQEVNEMFLTENYKVDFNALGEPQNTSRRTRKAQRKRLEKGSYNRMNLISTAQLKKVLNDMGYTDDQIRAGINSGAIQVGRRKGGEWKNYDNLNRQNRKDARLMSRMNMRVAPYAQNQTQATGETQPQEEFPWSNIPEDQIAWGQNKPVRQQARPQTAPAQTQQQKQPVQAQQTTEPEQQPVARQTTEPAQPQRRQMEPIKPNPAPISAPTGVTAPEPQTPTFAQNAIGTMTKTAMADPNTASQREKNAALRRMRDNAVAVTRRSDYGPTAKQDRKNIRDTYKNIKRGNNNPAI